jgi:hypothetical protein
MPYLFLFILSSLLLAACSEPPPPSAPPEDAAAKETVAVPPEHNGCRHCHAVHQDKAHDFSCSDCHGGNDTGNDKHTAHLDLVARPAHPTSMVKACGPCHPDQTAGVAHSIHFTLADKINLTRKAFGALAPLDNLTQVPIHEVPESPLQLADDLLRRRCLRCHPYSSGDPYPLVGHGTGCAACHLDFSDGAPVTHTFLAAPTDKQCLQCHYGNWVGADYHGRFEHDFNEEYRTPYFTRASADKPPIRPYGVEYHQLVPDLHQQKGMICIDCHNGAELMNRPSSHPIRCQDCHLQQSLEKALPSNVTVEAGQYFLQSRGDRQRHAIPVMRHPAHTAYRDSMDCQVCHAQWAFNDIGTHLLRNDTSEQDTFWRLTTQGSWEVEQILSHNQSPDTSTTLPPTMADKISGELKKGIWHQGYTMRRWETIQLGRDEKGKIFVMRPILDLHLSWIDENHRVRFDAVTALSGNKGLQPYVPHTTGPAGMFYRQRLQDFYEMEEREKNAVKKEALNQ